VVVLLTLAAMEPPPSGTFFCSCTKVPSTSVVVAWDLAYGYQGHGTSATVYIRLPPVANDDEEEELPPDLEVRAHKRRRAPA
jgi:hypothetical protein